MTLKHSNNRKRTDKLDFIKMKKCCASKDTTNRVKRQTTK